MAKGKQNTLSLLYLLNQSIESNDVINVNGAIFRINKTCNLSISMLGDALCDSMPSELKLHEPSVCRIPVGAIVRVTCAFLILLLIIIIVSIVVLQLRHKATKRYYKM